MPEAPIVQSGMSAIDSFTLEFPMMLLKKLTLMTLLVSPLATVACTNDSKKFEEPVTASNGAEGSNPNGTSNPNDFKVDEASGKIDFSAEVVYFEFDDATLTKDGMAQLDALAKYMSTHPATKLNIEGNSDDRGSTEYNLALGQKRSDAVKKYLVSIGVPAPRLATISFGEEKPSIVGDNEAAWAKNRRAEFAFSK